MASDACAPSETFEVYEEEASAHRHRELKIPCQSEQTLQRYEVEQVAAAAPPPAALRQRLLRHHIVPALKARLSDAVKYESDCWL